MTELADHTQRVVGKRSTVFSYHMMPFMSYVPSLYMHYSTSPQEAEEQAHHQRLSNILNACNMHMHKIAGDGNCCFSSIAFSLLQNFHQMNDQSKTFWHQKGIEASKAIHDLAITLRHLAVKEWSENSHRYQPFLSGVNIREEAVKFLDPSTFQGDLGDTMLTCLANVLEAPILVFSSLSYHPIVCVTPETQRVSVPLMVAYNQYGAGHFDGVIHNEQTSTGSDVKEHIVCTCGKNDKSNKEHCCEVKHKYTSSINCPCLKHKKGCGKDCKCRNCTNIHGSRPILAAGRRCRQKHEWQLHKSPNSREYASFKQETLTTGPLTKHEYFLLENILLYCSKQDIDVNVENITALYMEIIHSITTESAMNLYNKSSKEIEKYLKARCNILKTFKELCKMQLHYTLENTILDTNNDTYTVKNNNGPKIIIGKSVSLATKFHSHINDYYTMICY